MPPGEGEEKEIWNYLREKCAGGLHMSSDGIECVGIPAGAGNYVQEKLREVAENHQKRLDALRQVPSQIVRMRLLRECLGAKAINHLLRCLPPSTTERLTRNIWEQVLNFVADMAKETREDLTIVQQTLISLPARLGGTGIPNPNDLAEPAYLAATYAQSLTPSDQRGRARVEENFINNLQQHNMEIPEEARGQPMSQQDYTELVNCCNYNLVIQALENNAQRTATTANAVRGASSWFINTVFDPRPGKTCPLITNDELAILLRRLLHLGVHDPEHEGNPCPMVMRSTGAPCQSGIVDHNGFHTEKCQFFHVHRHNYIARQMANYFRDQQLEVRREQSVRQQTDYLPSSSNQNERSQNPVPGDVVVEIKDDKGDRVEIWLDVAVISEASHEFNVKTNGTKMTRKLEKKKRRKYEQARFESSATFYPAVASTSGAWGQEANAAFTRIAEHLAREHLTSVPSELKALRQLMTTLVMKRIASDIQTMSSELRKSWRRHH
jgi:hypothetical protein